MFTRSIFIPSLVVCAIAAPILFSQAKQGSEPVNPANGTTVDAGYANSGISLLPAPPTNSRFGMPNQQSGTGQFSTVSNSSPRIYQPDPFRNPANLPVTANQAGMSYPGFQSPTPVGSGLPIQFESKSGFPGNLPRQGVPLSGWNPDIGNAQTLIYPGDANGPDLTATPLEFMPISSFDEIFRFDVSSDWIMSRWKRVSTCPGDPGLHGMRVALVTGTNSWDLHGSLTYYFDANQQPQRITFRGWAGDAKKLTEFLTQRFGFKSQPTDWAGFFLAEYRRKETGAILMQYPAVIYRENPIQQVAVVMEINNPQGKFVLSDGFQSMIAGSQNTRQVGY